MFLECISDPSGLICLTMLGLNPLDIARTEALFKSLPNAASFIGPGYSAIF